MLIQQLYHVIKSYLNRKLFWLLATFYALLIWGDCMVPMNGQPSLWQATQVRWLPSKEFEGFTAFLEWPATDEELRDLRGLRINGQFVVPTDQLGPNGKPMMTLKVDAKTSPEIFAKLEKCKQLTELHLLTVELTPELGESLAKLPSLQQLELSLIGTPIASLQPLPSLSNLRFFQVPQVPPAELGLLAKHPRLTTVLLHDALPLKPLPGELNASRYEIWNQPSTLSEAVQIESVIVQPMSEYTKALSEGTPHHRIPPEAFQKAVPISETLRHALVELPNLRAIEIRDPWMGWPPRTIDDVELRKRFANRREIAINPMSRHMGSVLSPFTAISSVCLLFVLGTQLLSQFGSGWSRTVPNFARAHLIIAMALLLAHLVLSASVLVIYREVAWLPALALVAIIPATVGLITIVAARHPTIAPFIAPIAFASITAVMVGVPLLLRETLVTTFANGEQPWLALSFLLVELLVFVWAGQSLMQLPIRFGEAGIAIGQGLAQTLQQLQMKRINQNRQQMAAKWSWRLVDNRLEAYLAHHASTNRRKQWGAVETIGWQQVLMMCLLGPWFVVGIFMITLSMLSDQTMSLPSYVFYSVLMGTFSLTFATTILAGRFLSRRPLLGQELLRPMRRREMEQLLSTATLFDLLPALLLTAVYLIILYSIHGWGPTGWTSSPRGWNNLGHALLCLTLPIPLWSGLLHLLTIKSEFWRGALLMAGYFLLFGIVQVLTVTRVIQNSQASVVLSTSSYWLAAICLVAGAGLTWWGQRRLQRVEWGAIR